ncbi:DnaJ subfamily C member 7 [Ananas comosus]|uniref:DnaJ subfamily C member 7 n=1 Tax=Ananas comosus TaxID=4615 RepID=A0A199UVE7_ANACO|nr:DnaJ subfamily C member 7 [Ananas comosus]
MSPSMVGLLSPPPTSPSSRRFPPPNPRKPQIPPHSDLPPIPLAAPSMDRPDLGFDPPFPSPAPSPFPAISSPALSKPRLTKLRKHLGSSRARATPVPAAASASAAAAAPAEPPAAGFNPFASAPSEGGAAGAALHEKLRGWHPFNPERSSRRDASSFAFGSNSESNRRADGVSGAFVFGDGSGGVKGEGSDGAAFVFGASSSPGLNKENVAPENKQDDCVFKSGVEGSWNLSVNSSESLESTNRGNAESQKPEVNAFAFGADNDASQLDMKNIELDRTVDGTSISGKVGGGNDDAAGVFVFGVGMGKPASATGGFDPVRPESAPFLFGMSSKSNSDAKDVEPRNERERSGDSDSGVFAFGRSGGGHSESTQSSSLGSDEGSFSKLPDEMRKLNLRNSGGDDGYEKTKQTDQRGKMDESDKFVSSANTSIPSSFGGIDSKELPEEMNKLNIGSAISSQNVKNVFTFGSNAPSSSANSVKGNSAEPPEDSIHAGGSTNNGNRLDVFVFGRANNVSHKYEGTAVSMLNDDIEKLNISREKEDSPGLSECAYASTSTSCKAAFQADKQDSDVKTSAIPQSEPEKPQGEAAPFVFTSMREGIEAVKMEFRATKEDASGFVKEGLFSFREKKGEAKIREKKGEAKSTRVTNRRTKTKKSAPFHQTSSKRGFTRENSSPEDMQPESPGGYSPMDCSPYQEILADEQFSREASVASDESVQFFSHRASSERQKSSYVEEDLVSSTENLVISEEDRGVENIDRIDNNFVSKSSGIDEAAHAPFSFKSKDVDVNNVTASSAMEAETHFTSSSSFENFGGLSFTFATSPFSQGPVSASKRLFKKKNRSRSRQPSPALNSMFSVASNSMQSDASQTLEGTPSVSQSVDDNKQETNETQKVVKEPIATGSASVVAQEACEKWRIRGNQAYANGLLSKAEEYYIRGINSIPPNETSGSCMRALMLCYSNRAATRMSLGRMREALSDCMAAAAIDPSFLRAQVRAANCQLALGEIEDALKNFKKCLQSNKEATLDQKILTEASEGLQKAQLRRYEEVIQFCEQTLDLAERNTVSCSADGQSKNVNNSEQVKCYPRLWRWRLISKSNFYLGKLEEALDLLKKHEQVEPIVDRYGKKSLDSASSFARIVRELLRLKAAGNEAFQAGRYSEAVEHYTSALSCNSESRSFAAVCFCNRAAAYQALGQITDAIADCSLAIALDASYPKAISRRATLHEMIRDYGQAANDLRRLISLLEKQIQENPPGVSGKLTSISSDLNRARIRFSHVEDEARKDIPLDMYLILGIESSSSAADVKKAYRKAALRHHPDKASQLLVRTDNVDDALWRELADEVHRDADRLFKMIGEAYTILSDPSKRSQYDTEEEIRATLKKGYTMSSTPKTSSECYYSSQYERSSGGRQWRTYGSTKSFRK